MPDTRRTLAALQSLLADNESGAISAQDLRDFLVSATPVHGSLYVSTPVQTVIANPNEWTKTLGITTTAGLDGFDSPVAGRLRYTGTPDVFVTVVCTLSFTSVGNNLTLDFRLVKNATTTGADTVASNIMQRVGTGADVASATLVFSGILSTNDYIELWVLDEDDDSNMTVESMNLTATGFLA